MTDTTFRLRRAAAQDRRLSFRARGILAEHKSRPRGWRSDAVSLSREAKEGEHAVRTALRELEEAGYLRRERVRNHRGQMVTEWMLDDRPHAPTERRFPPVGSPPVGQPPDGSPPARKPPAGKPPVIEKNEREKKETPPPTPAVDELAEARAEGLRRVVVEEIQGKAPEPGTTVLRTACRRLHADGWTKEQLAAAIRAHDWTGARAGAVVAYLRGLTTDDQAAGAARERARKRPDWCGRCDETTRLSEDPQNGRQRRCPDCHPLAGKARRTT